MKLSESQTAEIKYRFLIFGSLLSSAHRLLMSEHKQAFYDREKF